MGGGNEPGRRHALGVDSGSIESIPHLPLAIIAARLIRVDSTLMNHNDVAIAFRMPWLIIARFSSTIDIGNDFVSLLKGQERVSAIVKINFLTV